MQEVDLHVSKHGCGSTVRILSKDKEAPKVRKQMSWMPWISVYDLSLKVRTKEKSWINFIQENLIEFLL